jgi:N-acetylglucosamine kinase-like BadF-type ATPase
MNDALLFAGVDAGGSRVRAGVGPSPERVVACEETRAVRLADGPIALAATVTSALGRALARASRSPPLQALVVGAAGATHEGRAAVLAHALRETFLARQVSVVTDVELILADAFGTGPGVALIAGTGSIAMGRLPSGELIRAGGRGAEVGDPGSAYAIGLGAVREVLDPGDDRLERLVLDQLDLADRTALTTWVADAAPAGVATLARGLLHGAARGVAPAVRLAERAVTDLVGLVTDVASQFRVPPVEVVLAGGLFADAWFRDRVVQSLEGIDPSVRLRAETADGVRGALKLAIRLP